MISPPPRHITSLLLATVVLLAGCTNHAKPDPTQTMSSGPTPTTSPTTTPPKCPEAGVPTCSLPPPVPHRFEMNDCFGYATHVTAEASKVKALLPEGYSPNPVAGSSFVQGNLNLFSCDSIVLDNQTVVKNFQISEFWVPALVPSSVASPDPTTRPDFYVLELIVNSQTVADAFAQLGFSALMGQIDDQSSPPAVQYHVFRGGMDVYDYIGGGEATASQPGAFTEPGRLHQVNAGHSVWANVTDTVLLSYVGNAGTLAAHGGAVMQSSSGGTMAVQTGIVQGREVREFSLRT